MVSGPAGCEPANWPPQIQAFAQLLRPTLAVLAALSGCATLYALDVHTPLQSYGLIIVILSCTTGAAFAINDYWDVAKDRIDHPERPLPSGRLSPAQAWWAAVVLFASALTAAVPLGAAALLVVVLSILLLWHYSHLLSYSGLLGNGVVAMVNAASIFLGSVVAGRPGALLYPTVFLFGYAFAKEIIWDIHDAQGDLTQGVSTLANRWGDAAAFRVAWGLLLGLMGSIPAAWRYLPMSYPSGFAWCTSAMVLTVAIPLACYQRERNAVTYAAIVLWGRIGMVLGIVGLLSTAPLR